MVFPRRRKSETVYYARFRDNTGEWTSELVGTDKRRAESVEAQRRREVADGTYRGRRLSSEVTLNSWITHWINRRDTKTISDDRQRLDKYVRPALGARRMSELEPVDCIEFVRDLVRSGMNPKTVSNVWGALRTCLRDANIAGTWVYTATMPRGVIPKRQKAVRDVYEFRAVQQALSGKDELMRRFAAVALFTGMREGEICGLRWGDWIRECEADSLTCLVVRRQYDGEGDNSETKTLNPRLVPVHPILEDILAQALGNDDAPIVPHPLGKPHSKSTCYKGWRAYCADESIRTLGIHRMRHTAITAMRRGGALPSDVEQITHNSAGTIVDRYSHEWSVLCKAVLGIDYITRVVTRVAGPKMPLELVEAPGIEPGANPIHKRLIAHSSEQTPAELPANAREIPGLDASRDARREFDVPDRFGAPGLIEVRP